MKALIYRFFVETAAQDLIEYALLAGIVALGVVVGMGSVRDAVNGQFNTVSTSLGNGS